MDLNTVSNADISDTETVDYASKLTIIEDLFTLLCVIPSQVYPITIPWYFNYVCAIVAGLLLLYKSNNQNIVEDAQHTTRTSLWISFPALFGMLWTLLLLTFHPIHYTRITRVTSLSFQYISALVLALGYESYYGKESIRKLFIIVVTAALISFSLGVITVGFSATYERIVSGGGGTDEIRRFYELHDIGYFAPLYVFYLFAIPNNSKYKGISASAACIISLLCYKRIALLAGVILSIIGSLLQVKDRRKGTISILELLVQVGIVIFIVIWIKDSSNGHISEVATRYGVTLNGRDFMWQLANDRFPKNAMGYGAGSVGLYLESIRNNGLNIAATLHNDLLRIKIEYGMVGLMLWILYMVVFLPTMLASKYGYVAKRTWLLILLYLVISYATSNAMLALVLQTQVLLMNSIAVSGYEGTGCK